MVFEKDSHLSQAKIYKYSSIDRTSNEIENNRYLNYKCDPQIRQCLQNILDPDKSFILKYRAEKTPFFLSTCVQFNTLTVLYTLVYLSIG